MLILYYDDTEDYLKLVKLELSLTFVKGHGQVFILASFILNLFELFLCEFWDFLSINKPTGQIHLFKGQCIEFSF